MVTGNMKETHSYKNDVTFIYFKGQFSPLQESAPTRKIRYKTIHDNWIYSNFNKYTFMIKHVNYIYWSPRLNELTHLGSESSILHGMVSVIQYDVQTYRLIGKIYNYLNKKQKK